MVVIIEKYFKIYVVLNSVVEYKNVRIFRNIVLVIFLLCFFNMC